MNQGDRLKRLQEISLALKSFSKFCKPNWLSEGLTLRYDAANLICDKYCDEALPLIKSFLKEGRYTNRFKVASATELVCFSVSPIIIESDNIGELKAINGAFSFYLAFQILHSIYFREKYPDRKSSPALHWSNINSTRKEQLFELVKERLNWYPYFLVDGKNIEELPIFVNSHYWQAISYYLKEHLNS